VAAKKQCRNANCFFLALRAKIEIVADRRIASLSPRGGGGLDGQLEHQAAACVGHEGMIYKHNNAQWHRHKSLARQYS
jgi:hypothetical protein